MTLPKLGLIGVGNMGGALLQSALKSSSQLFEQYILFDLVQDKTAPFAGQPKITIAPTLEAAINQSDYILLAVKPQTMKTVLEAVKETPYKSKCFISIAAGLTVKFYKDILGSDALITRVMPNTPYMVGEGAAGITMDPQLKADQAQAIRKFFQLSGQIIECDEKLLDAVTGLSGSGPAYIFMVIEALADGGVRMGLGRDQAVTLAAQTVLGAAKMVLTTHKHPGQLKDMVTSPGGTTIDAVAVLEEGGLRGLFIKAVEAATKKANQLAK